MTESQSTSNPAERLHANVSEIHVPEPSADTETLLMKLGIGLPILGLVLILIAWYNASGTAFVADQIPMLISGGLLGLALAMVGLGLFIRFSLARILRFWLARLVVEQQAQTDRVVDALARVEVALRSTADRN